MLFSGHSGEGTSQWDTTSQCNVVSHWLNRYPDWSLVVTTKMLLPVTTADIWYISDVARHHSDVIMRTNHVFGCCGVEPWFMTLRSETIRGTITTNVVVKFDNNSPNALRVSRSHHAADVSKAIKTDMRKMSPKFLITASCFGFRLFLDFYLRLSKIRQPSD